MLITYNWKNAFERNFFHFSFKYNQSTLYVIQQLFNRLELYRVNFNPAASL